MVPLAQFASTTLSLLLALATNIHCDTPYAKKVPQHLDERTTFYGGFALLDSTCATGLVNCGWPGCCPPSTVCDAGGAGGAHCCPDCKFPFSLMNALLMHSQPMIAMHLWTAFRFALILAGQCGKVMALEIITLMATTSFPSTFVAKLMKSGWLMIYVCRVVRQSAPA
jgi:hypothetical protein